MADEVESERDERAAETHRARRLRWAIALAELAEIDGSAAREQAAIHPVELVAGHHDPAAPPDDARSGWPARLGRRLLDEARQRVDCERSDAARGVEVTRERGHRRAVRLVPSRGCAAGVVDREPRLGGEQPEEARGERAAGSEGALGREP